MKTIALGLEKEDQKRTWIEDAEMCIARRSICTARAIYAYATSVYNKKKSLWLRMADLERQEGCKDKLISVLQTAVENCPGADILWLMLAKEQWLGGDITAALETLKNAFKAIPTCEEIWLAAVKLEKETGRFDKARLVLTNARKQANSKRVWMKSAMLERSLKNYEEEGNLLDEGIRNFPRFPKLWMMRGQLWETLGDKEKARAAYQRGLKLNAHSVALWLCASRLEFTMYGAAKTRALLEKARLHNRKNARLWLESVRVEIKSSDNKNVATSVLAKALHDCPTSGILWAERIRLEKAPQKRARSFDALKKCDQDPYVMLEVAKLFWKDRKINKARTWFNRVINRQPDFGDAWATYYRFEVQHGTEEQREALKKKCIDADPRHGELWINISKSIENEALKPGQLLLKVAASIRM